MEIDYFSVKEILFIVVGIHLDIGNCNTGHRGLWEGNRREIEKKEPGYQKGLRKLGVSVQVVHFCYLDIAHLWYKCKHLRGQLNP